MTHKGENWDGLHCGVSLARNLALRSRASATLSPQPSPRTEFGSISGPSTLLFLRTILGQPCHLDSCGLTVSLEVRWWPSSSFVLQYSGGSPGSLPVGIFMDSCRQSHVFSLSWVVVFPGFPGIAFLRVSPLKNTTFFCFATPKQGVQTFRPAFANLLVNHRVNHGAPITSSCVCALPHVLVSPPPSGCSLAGHLSVPWPCQALSTCGL